MNSTSISIKKMAKELGEPQEIFRIGSGDSRLIGWEFPEGSRAIETNGDVIFELERGFEEIWEKYGRP